MNKENSDKLFKDFPEFFRNRDNLHVSLMGFGFECGDGWFDLIYNLCRNIKNHYLDGGIPEYFNVVQVKEKFGGLRFYVSSADDYVFDLVHSAEKESFFICEECGMVCPKHIKGKRYKSFYRDGLGWIRTLCDGCLEKHLVERGLLPSGSYISDWQRRHRAPFIEVKV